MIPNLVGSSPTPERVSGAVSPELLVSWLDSRIFLFDNLHIQYASKDTEINIGTIINGSHHLSFESLV